MSDIRESLPAKMGVYQDQHSRVRGVADNMRHPFRLETPMRKAATLFLALFLIQCLYAVDLPKRPAGFSWQEIPELKAAFLKPDGWYFKREDQKGTLAYFITKENIDQNRGQFETGLTVNVFHLKKDPAAEKGKALIASM